MYHWIEDEEFLKNMRRECSDIVNRLVQSINREGYLEVSMQMVESGARNLETQNGNEPIDLDYNICIKNIDGNIKDCEQIKEYIRKKFNQILNTKGLDDCHDSTSALTTGKMYIPGSNLTRFSIDLAIVRELNGSWFRLIHKKTGNTFYDEWCWNEGPNSKKLFTKVEWIKGHNHWNDVRETYLNKKNFYLRKQDHNHPSFNCYIEAVNEVYNKYMR